MMAQTVPDSALTVPVASQPVSQPTSQFGTNSIPASTAMPSGAIAAPPSGFTAFCDSDPDQCKAAAGNAGPITLSTQIWQTLNQVNTDWNSTVKPQEDAAHYGQVDYWTIPKDGYGDCEDYALSKRQALMAHGFSPSDLRLALALAPNSIAHVVLIVSTGQGDYVLDNLSHQIVPWTATGYRWIARQRSSGRQWAFVGTGHMGGTRIATADIMP